MSNYDFLGISFDEIKAEGLFPFEGGWNVPLGAIKVRRPENVSEAELGLDLRGEAAERKRWERVLPTLKNLKYLVVSRANQRFFDIIYELKNLERLHLYQTTVTDCSRIVNLKNFSHLCFGSSPKLSSIEPLAEMKSLQALELLGKFEKVEGIDPIGKLTRLRGLSLCGQDYYNQPYDSLAPIEQLTNLRFLSLIAISVRQNGLRPIAGLKNLEYLSLSQHKLKQWSIEDYQAVYAGCCKMKGNMIRSAATDECFQRLHDIN